MPGHARPLTPERAARVRELHGLGRTTARIALEFGVGHTTAGGWLRALGLAPNPPPSRHEAFWTPERLDLGRRIAAEAGINTAGARRLGCSIQAFTAKAEAKGWPRRVLRARRADAGSPAVSHGGD